MIARPDVAEENGGTCVRRPCRVYHLWPELKTFKSRGLKLSSLSHDNREVSLYIQTFLNRPTFSEPASSLSADLGFSHLYLQKDVGFWRGNVVVGDREAFPVSHVEPIPRHQGEIDVGIMLGYAQEDAASATDISTDILDIAIPLLATLLDEYFTPLTRIQVDVWRGTERKFISPQRLDVERKDRDMVSVELLAQAFDAFGSLIEAISIEDLRGLAVASRRLNSAILEDEIIDKYCDFWECCEFLAPARGQINKIRLPKAKDAAISKLLCSYANVRKPERITRKVHELYDVRNDLVHNAVETPERVIENMRLLSRIAVQLFRCRVGMPFESSPELAPLL